MIQAAADHTVDFTRADPRSPSWWTYLDLMLERVEARSFVDYLKFRHAHTLATLTRFNTDQASLDKLSEFAHADAGHARRALLPWIGEEATIQDTAKAMTKEWAGIWGDPDSPETQAKIDATVEMMQRQLAQSKRNSRKTEL